MYRRRLLPLSTTSTSTTSFLKSDPKNYLNNFTNPPNKLTEFPGFLSQTSTDLLLASYRRHLVAVSELAFGTQATINQAQMELFRIVEVAERGEGRIRNPRLWHHASQAWNLEFFLRGLTCKEMEPSDSVINLLSRDFESFDHFKRKFQSHAAGMIGCGWVWLVKSANSTGDSLNILTTFNGATPLFKSNHRSASSFAALDSISNIKNSPILGLNLWESAFILDYGLDRDSYINNWWKAINWNVVSVLLSK